ncbi:MAG: hypothetical protein ACYCWW_06075 [Deltaproteobacteria bacterium]
MRPLTTAALFLAGGLIGTALDNLHVRGRILAYPLPAFAGEALWVPLLFGAAAVALVWNHRLLFRDGQPRGSALQFGIALLAFGLSYALTVALRTRPWLVLVLLASAWLLSVRTSPRLILYGLGVALIGPLVEAALCHVGAFRYLARGTIPGLGVPLWLPALYLMASVATAKLDLAFFPPVPMAHRAND